MSDREVEALIGQGATVAAVLLAPGAAMAAAQGDCTTRPRPKT